MGKSWAASLLIGVIVSGAMLTLYHVHNIFFRWAVKLEEVFFSIFQLSALPELSFHLPVQYAYFTIMAFLSAWVCMELPRWFSKVAYIVGAVFLTLLLSPILSFCGLLFEPFSGAGAIILAGLGGMIYGGTAEMQRARSLHRYFVGRISTEKFNRLVSVKEPVKLSGQKEMTVLTCRMLNFPDMSAQMEPQDVEKMGSFFLRAAAEFLVSKGAYLDSCNAQGVRVFFGMLDNTGEHAVEGCLAALELRQRLANLEQEIQNKWHKKPVFGVALSTGQMSLGLFGFSEFQFYSAIGEPVDFCRRLCSVNLVYGSQFLMGARTFHLTKERMETRPMEMVYAPRMHHISEVYELLGEKGTLSDQELKARDEFWHGVVSLRKGAYKDAVQHLKRAKLDSRDDAPLKYFLERAEAGLREDEESESAESKGVARHVRVLTAN